MTGKNQAVKAFATYLKKHGTFLHKRSSMKKLRRLVQMHLVKLGWRVGPVYYLPFAITGKEDTIWRSRIGALAKWNGKAGLFESI
jgi:hypothetical protein